jgi:PTH1 family peptidyl-tRNA hydrolase
MKLIVGLGNPGFEYAMTRHNVGFMVIDRLLKQQNNPVEKTGFKGRYSKFKISGEDVVVIKPETFMNLSGESIRAIVDFYHISIDDVLVVYDDVDLMPGSVRIRESGSSGGHNGIKSIISHLGNSAFKRIRIGVGKDPIRPTADHVLSVFSKEESPLIENAIEHACKAITTWMNQPFEIVMNRYNLKHEKPS